MYGQVLLPGMVIVEHSFDLPLDHDDPSGESEETAGLIAGLRPWITNEYEHNGLRVDGERVLGRLIELARGPAS